MTADFFPEPDEWYEQRVLSLADGTRDASDVILAICGTHPNEASVRRAIWRLISSYRLKFDDELHLQPGLPGIGPHREPAKEAQEGATVSYCKVCGHPIHRTKEGPWVHDQPHYPFAPHAPAPPTVTVSDPVHRGPDNHADWCHTEHDGWCLDVLLAKIGMPWPSAAKEAQPPSAAKEAQP